MRPVISANPSVGSVMRERNLQERAFARAVAANDAENFGRVSPRRKHRSAAQNVPVSDGRSFLSRNRAPTARPGFISVSVSDSRIVL